MASKLEEQDLPQRHVYRLVKLQLPDPEPNKGSGKKHELVTEI